MFQSQGCKNNQLEKMYLFCQVKRIIIILLFLYFHLHKEHEFQRLTNPNIPQNQKGVTKDHPIPWEYFNYSLFCEITDVQKDVWSLDDLFLYLHRHHLNAKLCNQLCAQKSISCYNCCSSWWHNKIYYFSYQYFQKFLWPL